MQKHNVAKKDSAMFSIGRASEYLGVSIDTLRRWEKREKISAFRSPGGHRYFKKEDLDSLFGTKYQRDLSEEKEMDKPEKNGHTEQKEKEEFKTVTEISDKIVPVYEQIGKLLERPHRELEIPQIKPVAIRSARYEEETVQSISETSAYLEKTESVEVNTLLPKMDVEAQEIPSDQPTKVKSQQTLALKDILNKTNILLILAIITVITTCLALVLYFYSQPKIISPLPSQY